LASTIDLVEQLLDLAIQRGDGSGMQSLRLRVKAILDPPKSARTALEATQTSIDREHGYWIDAISDILLPAQRDGVAKALRADRDGDGGDIIDDPWGAIDPDVRRARDQALEARIVRAEHAAIVDCLRYEHTRRTSFLREAVLGLESAIRAENRLSSGPPEAACGMHRDRLGRALRQVLPASAFRFFVKATREVIEQLGAETNRKSLVRGSEPEQWFSRGDWTVPRLEERAVGVWFVDWLQDRYEKEMERDRLAEESEKRTREQAAEKLRLWQAAREDTSRRERAEETAPDRDAAPKDARLNDSKDREARQGAQVSRQLDPGFDADYRSWPVHAEKNARLSEAAQRNAIEEQAEYSKARRLLSSKEADRIQFEAAEKKRVDAFKAKAARKASPARIQSSD
jgi:hypothetical protein